MSVEVVDRVEDNIGLNEASSGEAGGDLGSEPVEVDLTGELEQDLHPVCGLAHLVFGDVTLSSEWGAHDQRVNREPVGIDQAVVEPALYFFDPGVCGSTGTRPVDDGYLIGDFEPDERQDVVGEVGDVDLGGSCSGRDRIPIDIDWLDNREVVIEVHSATA
jgi:hypothetical protein